MYSFVNIVYFILLYKYLNVSSYLCGWCARSEDYNLYLKFGIPLKSNFEGVGISNIQDKILTESCQLKNNIQMHTYMNNNRRCYRCRGQEKVGKIPPIFKLSMEIYIHICACVCVYIKKINRHTCYPHKRKHQRISTSESSSL